MDEQFNPLLSVLGNSHLSPSPPAVVAANHAE